MNLIDVAIRAATEAGALLLERFGAPARGVGEKSSGTDMVSDADRDAESLIVGRLLADRPDDSILGEERGERRGTSGLRWLIDPLDGTTNFLYGVPQWCVSIACVDADGGLAGVVHDPLRSETFTSVRGGGTELNGEGVRVSAIADLSKALVATGFAYRADERAAQGSIVAMLLPHIRDVRRFGSAALDLAWTACGRFDAYYEAAMAPWDMAAGSLLAREAGAVVSELQPVGASGRGGILATNRVLHDALAPFVAGGDPAVQK